MTAPRIHLRHDRDDTKLTARSLCGVVSWHWTDDAQAVTCLNCIAHMELQPA